MQKGGGQMGEDSLSCTWSILTYLFFVHCVVQGLIVMVLCMDKKLCHDRGQRG